MKNLSVKLVFSGIIACLVLLMLVFTGSCGKSKTGLLTLSIESP